MKPFLIPCLAAVMVAVGCQRPTQIATTTSGGGGGITNHIDNTNIDKSAGEGAIEYQLRKVENSEMVAYTYLMPVGWTNEDSVTWAASTVSYPITTLATTSPDKRFALVEFPMLAGFSSKGPMGGSGEMYQSAGDATDAEIAKDTHISNYKVEDRQTQQGTSEWPQNMGGQTKADMAITRASFTEDGIEKEGVFVAKLDTITTADAYTSGGIWHLSLQIMSAPAGQLNNPAFAKMATTFFATASITPDFNAKWNQVTWEASQNNRRIAQQEDEAIMKNYWDHWKEVEPGLKDFDDYIKGTSSYTNPNGGPPMVLPTGNWYMNQQGNYVQGANGQPPEGGGYQPMNIIPNG